MIEAFKSLTDEIGGRIPGTLAMVQAIQWAQSAFRAVAAEKLACRIFEPAALPEQVDCVFSAHVIEHLTSPNILWEVARRVVKPGGLAVFFTPNGEPSLARTNPNYHRWWGQAHPLMLNADCLQTGAAKYGFSTVPYSSPYDSDRIRSHAPRPSPGQ